MYCVLAHTTGKNREYEKHVDQREAYKVWRCGSDWRAQCYVASQRPCKFPSYAPTCSEGLGTPSRTTTALSPTSEDAQLLDRQVSSYPLAALTATLRERFQMSSRVQLNLKCDRVGGVRLKSRLLTQRWYKRAIGWRARSTATSSIAWPDDTSHCFSHHLVTRPFSQDVVDVSQ